MFYSRRIEKENKCHRAEKSTEAEGNLCGPSQQQIINVFLSFFHIYTSTLLQPVGK